MFSLFVANLRNSQLLRAICALKSSLGVNFHGSPEGVKRKDVLSHLNILSHNLLRPDLIKTSLGSFLSQPDIDQFEFPWR